MARICAICDKRPQVANTVSNANNRTKRWVYPNVHTMRFILPSSGNQSIHRAKVCTKCVKAGKVQKII
ncbi:50S ribosomal protein L28 [Candidatus Dependentiae bacterium]|nr:MAG: 50S ribosomal protein L28 [Candidatus Dependentiae bacterium]